MADMTQTTNFISTLTQTPIIAGELNSNLQRLKDDLDEIIKVLTYPKTISDDLSKLNTALSDASELLTFVSIIPEVGEAAAPLKEAIAVLQPEVKSALSAAQDLEALVKPLREALEKLDPVLDDLIAATQKVEDTSKQFLADFTTVYDCVMSLPDGSAKDASEAYLNDFSQTAEPLVVALNTTMSEANTVISEFYDELNKITEALDPLADIIDDINDVLNVLNPVIDLLEDLKNDLENIKITIPIPGYPVEVSLYDVFKDFSEFIDEALKPIQDLVDEVLKALDITLPSIPGLDDIINIHITIPDIPDFSAYFDSITQELDALLAELAKFDLKCPPDAV